MTSPAATPVSSPASLIERAGLDRTRLAGILAHGLDGADDGELYLEYRQSEVLGFDNGRLKQATYDTSQGFGLRAVKDEAVGYAHASDVSEEAIRRAADSVRAVKGGYAGHVAAGPARTNVRLYTRRQPAREPAVRDQGQAAAGDRRLCARQGCAGAAGDGERRRHLAGDRDPAPRRRDLSRRAAAGAAQRVGRRRRRRPPGDRQPRLWRPRGLRALRRRRGRGAARWTTRCARRWSIWSRCRPRPARWTWCSAPAGPASCCTRRSATGSRAISTARRPPPSPA